MNHISSTPSDFVVDLGMCKITSEEAGSPDPIDKLGKRDFNKVCDGEELSRAENGLCLDNNIKDGHELSAANVTIFIDKNVEGLVAENLVEKEKVKDKRNSTSAKKPPKPPRPPRGLSLDAADQKLIKEIAELAMIKRARIERIKALKKMKAAKASSASSSTGSFLAFMFTVIFFLVLCFQGMSSGSSAVSSHDSPQASGSRSNNFIIHQYYSDLSAGTATQNSGSPNLAEQLSGSDPRDDLKRVKSRSVVF